MHSVFWLVNLKGREHLEDLGVDRMIILDWILGCGLDESGSG
jgi:hypothetical protein